MTEFWRDKPLSAMSQAEWESLCDRCGRCCLLKLEDVDSGELYFTSVACEHLQAGCQCRHYERRIELVDECLQLTPESLPKLRDHLPASCAYRRLAEGRPLPDWHPLISGDPDSVRRAGISVEGRVISEVYIHPEQYPEYIIHWQEREDESEER